MIKYSSIEIWSKIPPKIKNKTCLAVFLAEYKRYVLPSYENHILCFYLLLDIKQVDWFNYASLLQRKVSNHEVSLFCITSLGFCNVHRNLFYQTSVWSCGMSTKHMHFRSHASFDEFFSATQWLRDWFAICSWHYCDVAVVVSFWQISSLAFTNIFECIKTVNV